MTTVVVADDQPVVRTGFAALLSAQPDLDVVGEAADGAELGALAVEHRPDVAVVDVRMPVLDGSRRAGGSRPPASTPGCWW